MAPRRLLSAPCADCPFRSDRVGYLTRERMEEIVLALRQDGHFTCHKTIRDLGGSGNEAFCGGALVFMEKALMEEMGGCMGNRYARFIARMGGISAEGLDSISKHAADPEYPIHETVESLLDAQDQ